MIRIGHGYDAHRLVSGRKLILGGVEITHSLGLLGHSDADVLVHAICDAVLGALGEGDLGRHFPDSDPQYKGICSLVLLRHSVKMASEKEFSVGNVDATVVAQRPKLAAYIPEMKNNLAQACGVSPEQINVKATTTEEMGFEGRGEGISAHAVVLLRKISKNG